MRKAIKNILFILIVLLLAAAIAGTVGLRLLGYEFRAVLSGSMEPELPVGAMLLVRKTPFEEIRIGDDITFVRDATLKVVTHRVIDIDPAERLLTTKGLANNTPDAPVYYENVRGVVRYSVPKLGYAISFITTDQGKIISVTVIVSLVLIWLMLGLFGRKKKREDKTSLPAPRQLGSWLTPPEETGSYDK